MRLSVVRAMLLGSIMACAGSDATPVGPTAPPPSVRTAPTVQSITVALPAASLTAGSSQLVSATVKYSNDSVGAPPTLAWTSTNANVAVVSATGNVIAIATGVDTIVATVGAVRGQTVLSVTDAPPLPAGVLAVTAKAGEVQSFPLDGSVTGYQIPVLGTASSYVFIVADADTVALRTKSFGVSMDSGTVMAPSTPTTPVPSPARNVPFGHGVTAADNDIEGHIRAYERQNLPRLTQSMRARETLNGSGARATNNYSAGDAATIRVPGFAGDLCNSYTTVGAKVLAVSAKAIVLMDTTVAPDTGAVNAATQLAQEFDSTIYPTDTKYFGTPSDIDGNSKVMMLFTPIVNKLTPKGTAPTTVGYIGGFFSSSDLYPSASCRQSNLGEIFYLLAPDPNGTFGNAFTASFVREVSRGTVAHEFQHMINAGHRMAMRAPFENSWLDEGLAHLAEDLVGRAAANISDTQLATRAKVAANAGDFNAFFSQNVLRYQAYLAALGTTTATGDASSSLAVRGAAWSLLRNTADRYSGADVAAFTMKLETSGKVGVPNFAAAAGQTFTALIGSWAVANAYSALGVNGSLSYASYDFKDLTSVWTKSPPPLRLTAGIHTNSTVMSADARYFQATTNGASTPQTVHVVAASGTGSAVIPTSRLYVLRVQ